MDTTQDTRIPLISQDVIAERVEALRELFPEAFAEGAIDFAKLKQALGEFTDASPERYGLSWAGKSDAVRAVQSLSSGTLVPCKEESVNFDTTENLIIEGDNLEALKLLQKSYYGKVKMIYIDPPYNTGNEFIYPDNYREGLDGYLKYSGQLSDDGMKLETNAETSGRFHSKWLNMMYPRLFLAKNLLRDDGLIFISIDDNEIQNLRCLVNEVFGEENFVEQVIWKNKYGSGALTKGFANVHEYILCYSRTPIENIEAPMDEESMKQYKNRDAKYPTRGGYITQPLATNSKDERPNLYYPIHHKGHVIYPEKQWIWSKERFDEAYANDEIVINEKDGKFSVRMKQYLRNEDGTIRNSKPISIIQNGPFNQNGTKEIKELFGSDVFGFPKPSALIRYLISFVVNSNTDKDGLYLDFFSGSGPTAQAVLELNRADGGNRRFILVQLPEPTGRADYPTIADICKERVRRVIQKLENEDNSKLNFEDEGGQDRGFKVFKLTSSNFRLWSSDDAPKDADALAEQLRLYADHIVPGRSQHDILYELLLKAGLPLTAGIDEKEVNGQTVFSVADGLLLICLEDEITQETLRGMIEHKPETVLCLDSAFKGNDQLKTNIVLEMESHEIKFHTV